MLLVDGGAQSTHGEAITRPVFPLGYTLGHPLGHPLGQIDHKSRWADECLSTPGAMVDHNHPPVARGGVL